MRSLKPVHKIIASLRASLHFSTIKSTPPREEEPAQSRSETCNSGANNHRQGSEMHKASSKLACTHCHQSPTVAFFVSSDSPVLCRNPSSAPGVPLGHSAETGSLARVGDGETSSWASKELLHSQAGQNGFQDHTACLLWRRGLLFLSEHFRGVRATRKKEDRNANYFHAPLFLQHPHNHQLLFSIPLSPTPKTYFQKVIPRDSMVCIH